MERKICDRCKKIIDRDIFGMPHNEDIAISYKPNYKRREVKIDLCFECFDDLKKFINNN